MLRQMAQDHFILYLMLMSLLGLALGFVGSLVVYVILSWERIAHFMLDVLSLGGG